MRRILENRVFRSAAIRLAAAALLCSVILWIPGCPIRALTGVPCPGCGLTRAWFAAFRLDFPAAFSLHPLFLPAPAVILYCLFRDILPKHLSKRAENILFSVLGILFFTVYIIRIWVLKVDI